MRGSWGWGADPGPCPVDDTPHTACTPQSVAALAARGAIAVPLPSTPAHARAVELTVARRAPEPAPRTFTTKDYRGGLRTGARPARARRAR